MKRSLLSIAIVGLTLGLFTSSLSEVEQGLSTEAQVASSDWYVAGANPQRTSWVSEEVRGRLSVEWYKPIEPYISAKVQVIAADGLLYISTARGLYAIDAETGDEVWVYPTELPLGHSPTVTNGMAYVGGFDRKIHAIDAATGQGLWTFAAGNGFQTNPLVVGDKLYAGNRDGYFYAIYIAGPNTGQLAWKYRTGGPVLYSAAYKDEVVFFASNDSYAYALDAATGTLVWKSAKLPGAGFHSWWPVIYDDPGTGQGFVIFSGSRNYPKVSPGSSDYGYHNKDERKSIYELPDGTYPPDGTPVGPVTIEADGSTTIDASKITEYFEEPTEQEKAQDPAGLNRKNHKPWRRTVFYLDRATGQEYTFDSDGDGQAEYAPILYQGTHSGTRYPPVVGSDGVIYQANNYYSNRWIARGGVAGWDVGTHNFINVPSGSTAVDEPLAYSGGGNLIYSTLCCDRRARSFDVTIPNSGWTWWDQGRRLDGLLPGYNLLLYWGLDNYPGHWTPVFDYGLNTESTISNGIYGRHGEQNPPIPYQGRVYVILSNVLMALSPSVQWEDAVQLPMAQEVSAPENSPPSVTETDLRRLLEIEVAEILAAGHLQPGLVSTGIADPTLTYGTNDRLIDYWKAPGDILYHLIRAFPYLSPTLQGQVKDYLQTEFTSYPPYQFIHIGYADGTQREAFDRPPEIEVGRVNFAPRTVKSFPDWSFPPHQFYAMYKYAEMMDDPDLSAQIFASSNRRLDTPPPDADLIERPYVHNAYIAGYIGYIQLGKLAGLSDEQLAPQQIELDRLLALRVSTFSKDSPYKDDGFNYMRELNIARNFMFLVPELAAHLRNSIRPEIEEAIQEYDNVAPYWFVSKHECSLREGIIGPLYNYHALFQAKAQILQEPREELLKYLDVPGVAIGDLFYIDNLVATLEAGFDSSLYKTAHPPYGAQGESITYELRFHGNDGPLTLTDTLPTGLSAPSSFELIGTNVTPVYNASQRRLTWSDTIPSGQGAIIRYDVTVTTSESRALVNVARLESGEGIPATATATIIANPSRSYLPMIFREN